jgi:hypothetical protein
MMMKFSTFDEQEDPQPQDRQQDAGYIENWLHQASFAAASPFRPSSLCHASPIAPICEFVASGREPIREQFIYQSPSSTFDSPKNSMSDFFCNGADAKLFSHNSLNLHFDLENTAPMGVLDAVAGIQAPLIATCSTAPQVLDRDAQEIDTKEGLSYDPLYDGTPEDEHILRRNMRDPWPYDQRRLVPAHLQSTSIRVSASAPYPDSFTKPPARLSSLLRLKRKRVYKPPPQHQPAAVSRPTTSRIASCFGLNLTSNIGSMSFQLSSIKASKSKHNVGVRGRRIPNSMVPHPDWGTFPFRSDSDSVGSDDSDGDVYTWLQRVVRRNIRTGLESFKTATGHCRPMTIEEYEKCGSWLHERSQEWAAIVGEYGKQEDTTHRSSTSPYASSSHTSLSGGVRLEEIRSGSFCDDRNAPPESDYEAGSSFGADSFYASDFNNNSTTIHSLTPSNSPALPTLRSSQPQFVKNGFVHDSLSTHGRLPMSASINSAGRTLGKAARKTFGPFVRRAAGTISASYAMMSSASGIGLPSARRINATAGAKVVLEPLSSSACAPAGHRLPGTQDPLQANFAAHLPHAGRFTPASEVGRRTCGCEGDDDDVHLFDFRPYPIMTDGPIAPDRQPCGMS